MQTLYPVPIVLPIVNASGPAVLGLPQYNTNIEQTSVANERVIEAYWVWAEFH